MMSSSIDRHRTAIHRADFSRPVRLALEDGLVTRDTSVLDYGCGRGGDVERLTMMGVTSVVGWDLVHGTPEPTETADVVNLGFVVNVIEDPTERADVLCKAWALAGTALIVAARLVAEAEEGNHSPHADGVVTSRGTFQKFYEQSELREWVDGTLGQASVAAAPGVFYVFRNDQARQSLLLRRQSHRIAVPGIRHSDVLYEQHKDVLQQLMAFVADRGRLPARGELAEEEYLQEHLGSVKRAYSVVQRVTGFDQWDDIRQARQQDILVYLALAEFGGRPRFSELPESLRHDVKVFFSNYKQACTLADILLFSIADDEMLTEVFEDTSVGRRTDRALYVHMTALPKLPPLLRVYEGAARAYIGTIEGANVVKLHRQKPAVTYFSYDDFDDEPHPRLAHSLRVQLNTFDIKMRDFTDWADPPLLARKDELVLTDHPLFERFSRLSKQEDRWGVLQAYESTTTLKGLEQALRRAGAKLQGHRLLKQKNN